MFDDDDRSSEGDKVTEHFHEGPYVKGVKTDRRFVEYEDSVSLAPSHLAGELEPLGFASRKARSGFTEGEVPEAQITEDLQP